MKHIEYVCVFHYSRLRRIVRRTRVSSCDEIIGHCAVVVEGRLDDISRDMQQTERKVFARATNRWPSEAIAFSHSHAFDSTKYV